MLRKLITAYSNATSLRAIRQLSQATESPQWLYEWGKRYPEEMSKTGVIWTGALLQHN